MKSFKQFADTQDDISSGDLDKMYEEYQNEYKRRQLLVFFNEHKVDEWFKEKYEPSYLEQKRVDKYESARQNAKAFAEAYQQGTMEFNLNAADVDGAIKEGNFFKNWDCIGAYSKSSELPYIHSLCFLPL